MKSNRRRMSKAKSILDVVSQRFQENVIYEGPLMVMLSLLIPKLYSQFIYFFIHQYPPYKMIILYIMQCKIY